MVSLTPQENKAEVAGSAVREGAINGIMALIPSYGLFLVAMKTSPKFVKVSQKGRRTLRAEAVYALGVLEKYKTDMPE
jgi:hypothetical protein